MHYLQSKSIQLPNKKEFPFQYTCNKIFIILNQMTLQCQNKLFVNNVINPNHSEWLNIVIMYDLRPVATSYTIWDTYSTKIHEFEISIHISIWSNSFVELCKSTTPHMRQLQTLTRNKHLTISRQKFQLEVLLNIY